MKIKSATRVTIEFSRRELRLVLGALMRDGRDVSEEIYNELVGTYNDAYGVNPWHDEKPEELV